MTLLLFHWQTVGYGGGYVSDIPPYIDEMQGLDTGYDFPYPILFLTGRFFLLFTSPAHAMALAVTLWNGLTPVALKYYFDQFLRVRDADSAKRGIFSTLLVFSLLFASMLYPLTYLGHYRELEEGFLYRYLGTFTPNPYHNATYLTARPLSVPAFFLFADILTFYEKEDSWIHPKYLCFSFFLLLTTLAKPSFTLVLASAAGIIMLWRLVIGRFRRFKAFFQLGIWFVPTFLVLIYQFGSVFRPGSDTDGRGVGFGFLTAWSMLTDHIPLSILLALAFPLTVLLFGLMHKEISNLQKFSWQFFLAIFPGSAADAGLSVREGLSAGACELCLGIYVWPVLYLYGQSDRSDRKYLTAPTACLAAGCTVGSIWPASDLRDRLFPHSVSGRPVSLICTVYFLPEKI